MTHDVVTVGSGPAGYTAAICAARAQLNPVILAGSVTASGALMNMTEAENYPGFVTGITGPELMTQMREQAGRFSAGIRYEDVTALELEDDVKRITTSGGIYKVCTVIISIGSEYRHLGISGEERLPSHGMSHYATCDGFFFKDQGIVIVGGGDSAMEGATFLIRFARSMTVVHRRNELHASVVTAKHTQEDPKISFVWNSRVAELDGEGSSAGVILRDTVTGGCRRLRATGLFIIIGQAPHSESAAGVLDLDKTGYIKVEAPSQCTRIPRVFTCGDVTGPTYQQIIAAVGPGCRAALDAEHYLTILQARGLAASTRHRNEPAPSTSHH